MRKGDSKKNTHTEIIKTYRGKKSRATKRYKKGERDENETQEKYKKENNDGNWYTSTEHYKTEHRGGKVKPRRKCKIEDMVENLNIARKTMGRKRKRKQEK